MGGGGAGVLVGGGGGGVSVGGDSGVGVSVGDVSGTDVSAGDTGVGVPTTSGIGVFVGKRATVGVASGDCGASLISLGVLVGVGVTCKRAIGPQANIGTINITKTNCQNGKLFFIRNIKFLNQILEVVHHYSMN